MDDNQHHAAAPLISRRFHHHPVRLVILGGRPFWIAKDLLAILHNFQRPALAGLPDSHKRRVEAVIGSAPVLVVCVAEPGVRTLIARSRSPRREAFALWFDEEHLPSLALTPEPAEDEPQKTTEEERTMTDDTTTPTDAATEESIGEARPTKASSSQAITIHGVDLDVVAYRG